MTTKDTFILQEYKCPFDKRDCVLDRCAHFKREQVCKIKDWNYPEYIIYNDKGVCNLKLQKILWNATSKVIAKRELYDGLLGQLEFRKMKALTEKEKQERFKELESVEIDEVKER